MMPNSELSEPALGQAIGYVPSWLGLQLLRHNLPSVSVAISVAGRMQLQQTVLHPRLPHARPIGAYPVGSQAKPFAAAATLRLIRQGAFALTSAVGGLVADLPARVADATIESLLTHVSGLSRDGKGGASFDSDGTFPDRARLRQLLAEEKLLSADRSAPFRYSNLGYAVLGLVIEAATGLPYAAALERLVIEPLGLAKTAADETQARTAIIRTGLTGLQPDGGRLEMSACRPSYAYAPACGLVSSPADLCGFYWRLAPDSGASDWLSITDRHQMLAPHHRDGERQIGMGIVSGSAGGWDWFGHSGRFPGCVSRSVHLRRRGITIAVAANTTDAPVPHWVDGIMHILRCADRNGPASDATAAWCGRFWSVAGPIDLLPVASGALVGDPATFMPFSQANTLVPQSALSARLSEASGFSLGGEAVDARRDEDGTLTHLLFGGLTWVADGLSHDSARDHSSKRRSNPQR